MNIKRHKNHEQILIQLHIKLEALLNLRQKAISIYHREKWKTPDQIFTLIWLRAPLLTKKPQATAMKTLSGEKDLLKMKLYLQFVLTSILAMHLNLAVFQECCIKIILPVKT